MLLYLIQPGAPIEHPHPHGIYGSGDGLFGDAQGGGESPRPYIGQRDGLTMVATATAGWARAPLTLPRLIVIHAARARRC